MSKVFHVVFKIDRAGSPCWLASTDTREEAIAEAVREYAQDPPCEYRVLNRNCGLVGTVPPERLRHSLGN